MTHRETNTAAIPAPVAPPRSPNLLSCYAWSVAALVCPARSGRRFLRIPLWKAIIIAAFNLLLLAPPILAASRNTDLRDLLLYPTWFFVFLILGYLVMLFFVIMPFVPRPGASWPCIRHAVRSTLLATTQVLLWAAVFTLWYQWERRGHVHYSREDERWIAYAGIAAALLLYGLWAIVRASDQDYRRPQDCPGPRDPQCDDCGYDLQGLPPDGRCPECGKPLAESIGGNGRKPSPWESWPSPLNVGVVLRQIFGLFRHPMRLYRQIPLHDGHAAARRWLTLIVVLMGVIGFAFIPLLPFAGMDFAPRTFLDWQFLAWGLTAAAVWIFLGLMMVGIETVGVTLVAWRRGRPVDLAAASKVTCYASTLLLAWVILGSLHIMVTVAWIDLLKIRPQGNPLVPVILWADASARLAFGSKHAEYVGLGSLAAVHIGGLSWFELVVYRGLRAIQYANK